MMKKIALVVFFALLATAGYYFRVAIKDFLQDSINTGLPETTTYIEIQNRSDDLSEKNTNDDSTIDLPPEINLAVPFTSQAPRADWALPYQEACEEAAALMVHQYWQKQSFSSKEETEAAILDLVDFEKKNYGAYEHTTAAETAQLIKDRWDYTTVDLILGSGVTLDRIKEELAGGYPIIVLAAGRELGNPNYRQPGPLYHALVIKGYLADGKIITNDPGTRNGRDYLYNPEILINSIHDWNNGDVPDGQKNMIIIRPEK